MCHFVLLLAGGRYIEVFPEESTRKTKPSSKAQGQCWQRTKKDDEEEEDLSDSGRLFVRNLPYTSTEEDLEAIFSKHGRSLFPLRLVVKAVIPKLVDCDPPRDLDMDCFLLRNGCSKAAPQ